MENKIIHIKNFFEGHDPISRAEGRQLCQALEGHNCRCTLDGMDVLPAGYATQDGLDGADYWLTHEGKLPENYLTKDEAKKIRMEKQ